MATTISVKVNKGQTYGGALVQAGANSPTRTGYIFSGWNTKADGTGETRLSNQAVVKSETIYAQWTSNTRTVSFYPNGGSGSMSSQSVTYGGSVTLNLNTFTRTGYTFLGWATSSSGSVVYSDGATITNVTSNISLYAKWQVIPTIHTITYNSNGGSGTMANTTVNDGGDTQLRTNTFTRTDYTFIGWATSSSGSVTYNDGQYLYNVTSSLNLYAVWQYSGKTNNYISIDYSGNNVYVRSTYAVTSTVTVTLKSTDAGGGELSFTISSGSSQSSTKPSQFVTDWYKTNISPSEDSNYYYL